MAGWPWPLGGVQNWFEGLWSHVSTAAVNAVSVVWDWITEKVGWLWDLVHGLMVNIWTWTRARLIGLASSLTEIAGGLWDWITEKVGWLWDLVHGLMVNIWTWTRNRLIGLATQISDLAGDLWEAVAGAVGEVGNTLSRGITSITAWVSKGLGDLWAGFSEWGSNALGTVSTMFDGAVAGIGKWVSDALAGVAGALGSALSGFMDWLLNALGTVAEAIIGAAVWIRDAILGPITNFGRDIVNGLVSAVMPHSPDEQIKGALEKFASEYMKRIQDLAPEKSSPLPGLTELLAAAGGVITLNTLAGMGAEAIGVSIDQSNPNKNIGIRWMASDVINTFNFASVSGAILAAPVFPSIIIPLRYRFNEMFPNMLPSYGDMIRIYVREGYLPEYQEEIPAGMIGNFKLLGYDEYWTKALWGAHWVLPSTGQVFEMLHRGIIDDTTMSAYLKTADILKVWRSRLIAISWDLPGRIDARWMAGWDEIDVDEYGDLLVKRGLAPEWRDRVARATIKQQMSSEINKLRDNAKSDFVKGYILEDVLRADLTALGCSAAKIDYHVADALADRERKYKDDLLDAYWDGYLKDLITYDDLAARAREIIVDEPARELWLQKAYIRKYKRPKAG